MRLNARVVKGHGRGGSEVGFPTFNLVIPQDFSLTFGIYAAWIWIGEDRYKGALHFGPVPTFDDPTPSLEIFVLDYNSDLPVVELGFETVAYLREIRTFDTVSDLSEQIERDVKETRVALS